MRIYLTGFMGAGKTTVGRLLAERLAVPFVDLDRAIEEEAGLAVAQIFERRGEGGFRRLEVAALRRASRLDPCVVATGGGTPVDERARRWMRSHGRVVWLDLPFDAVRRRLEQSAGRPLYRADSARELYASRRPAYRDCDLAVAAGTRTADELAEEIARAVASGELR